MDVHCFKYLIKLLDNNIHTVIYIDIYVYLYILPYIPSKFYHAYQYRNIYKYTYINIHAHICILSVYIYMCIILQSSFFVFFWVFYIIIICDFELLVVSKCIIFFVVFITLFSCKFFYGCYILYTQVNVSVLDQSVLSNKHQPYKNRLLYINKQVKLCHVMRQFQGFSKYFF